MVGYHRLNAISEIGVPANPLLVTVFICNCSVHGKCEFQSAPPPNNGLVWLPCECESGYKGINLVAIYCKNKSIFAQFIVSSKNFIALYYKVYKRRLSFIGIMYVITAKQVDSKFIISY